MATDSHVKHALLRLALVLLCYGGAADALAITPQLRGDFRVHDPSMIKQGKTYYIFSTGSPDGSINDGNIQIRASNDLVSWRFIGTVFSETPLWITEALGRKPRSLWAPDVSYFNDKYHLYYSASFFGTNNSLVALATNRTLDSTSPDYKWIDEGEVIRTTTADNWNAIDPHISFDARGGTWMSLGSFWSGIKMRRMEARTGKLSVADKTLYSLAFRPTDKGGGPIEAPAIIRRKGYYYLFVSFDFCCRGIKSDYKIAVGRAHSITGPYFDRSGKRMDQGGGEIILRGDASRVGAGGQSVYKEKEKVRLVYHYYDALDQGRSKLRIATLTWTDDGWLAVADSFRV